MADGILLVCQQKAVRAGEGHACQHALFLGHKLLPVLAGRIVGVGRHKAVAAGAIVRQKIDFVADGVDYHSLIVLLRVEGDEFKRFLAEARHLQGIAEPFARFGHEKELAVAVGNLGCVEVERVGRIFIDELVGGLRRSETVVVDTVVGVGVREFLSLAGALIGAVEESVVAVPYAVGELRPLDMVF